ncbi:MAG: hypothetical protein K2H46_09455 [Muribaculaceae bacterium]|nr:hypothetical protein [Muribaculaceae bacterium]
MKQVIPSVSSKIEIIDKDGVFSIENRDGKEMTLNIANSKGQKLDIGFKSISNIGYGYFMVGQIKYKTIKKKITGYGFKGNPYTRIVNSSVKKIKYGIIDSSLQFIIPCKYEIISGFDENNNVRLSRNNKIELLSLEKLKQKSQNYTCLEKNSEYEGTIVAYTSGTLILEINKMRYSMHKKYINNKKFSKGEKLIVKFLGNDHFGYPIWEIK